MALPEPQCGLVISYSYLWRHEAEAGQTEGVKNRPCAIVLAVRPERAADANSATIVTVAPITHTPPRDPGVAIEIPAKVKAYLGLDGERSWIILNEFNEFAWPGFDLRAVPGKPGSYAHGFLPPAFYKALVARVLELRRLGGTFICSRGE